MQFALRNEKIRKKYQKELDEIEEKSLSEKMDLVRDLTPEIQSELPKYDSSFEVEMEAARLRSEIEKKEKEIKKIESFLNRKNLLNEFKNEYENIEESEKKNPQISTTFSEPTETYF